MPRKPKRSSNGAVNYRKRMKMADGLVVRSDFVLHGEEERDEHVDVVGYSTDDFYKCKSAECQRRIAWGKCK